MTVVAVDTVPLRAAAATHLRVAAIALLSGRLIQGFIHWGGAFPSMRMRNWASWKREVVVITGR